MVYGDFQTTPCPEDHPRNPKNAYGGCKLAAEIMTTTFARQFRIPYVIIRPSAVYGPTDANRRVVQMFVERALLGQPMILHNGGSATLDFTHVEDLAAGFVLATFADRAVGETFNITRGEGRSLKELALIIKKHVPQAQIVSRSYADERPRRGALDIAKARELLDYEPRYCLEDGIARLIPVVREHLDWRRDEANPADQDFAA